MGSLSWAAASRSGGHALNQDAVGGEDVPPLVLRVLAAGLGGHVRGEEAAALVVEHCCAAFRAAPSLEAGALEGLVHRANEALLRAEGDEDGARGNGRRSTVVLLVTDGVSARWAHVGDSRLYHFRNGRCSNGPGPTASRNSGSGRGTSGTTRFGATPTGTGSCRRWVSPVRCGSPSRSWWR